MVVGNVYYVPSGYNANKFKALLENQLAKRADIPPSDELVVQAIAAYLACKDANVTDQAMSTFERHLNSLNYLDKRDYCGNNVVGDPLEAVKAFNQLIIMQKLS